MARYSKQHKAQTRTRLLEQARGAFRRGGFEAVSIDKLMAGAGLTRGGFYAHFKSKEALFQEVLAAPSGLVGRLRRLAAGDRASAVSVLREYLDPALRDSREQCPMVAHAMDVRRGPDERSRRYQRHIQDLVAELERVGGLEAGDDAALEAAILAVGGATLAVAVHDDAFAEAIERRSEAAIERLLEREGD